MFLGVDVDVGVGENHGISRQSVRGAKYLYCITGGWLAVSPTQMHLSSEMVTSFFSLFLGSNNNDSELWAQADGNGESDDIGVKKKLRAAEITRLFFSSCRLPRCCTPRLMGRYWTNADSVTEQNREGCAMKAKGVVVLTHLGGNESQAQSR